MSISASNPEGWLPPRHEFVLPYFIHPEGDWSHSFDGRRWRTKIQHQFSPDAVAIVTGVSVPPGSPGRIIIDDPSELFVATSTVLVEELEPPPQWNGPRAVQERPDARNVLAALLNDLQQRYLHVSGKYWWNTVYPEHIVNLKTVAARGLAFSSNWEDQKPLPQWRDAESSLKAFEEHLRDESEVPIHSTLMTEAKRHYLAGEYHLMYVQAAVGLEAVLEPAYKALSNVYEQKLFKDGHLVGKAAFILHEKCGWPDDDTNTVVAAIDARNNVIHHRQRRFRAQVAHDHLSMMERAISSIVDWTSARAT